MLHPAGKHSSNGILRNTSYSRARDSSLHISVRSFFHNGVFSQKYSGKPFPAPDLNLTYLLFFGRSFPPFPCLTISLADDFKGTKRVVPIVPPVFLRSRKVYHFCMEKDRRKPQESAYENAGLRRPALKLCFSCPGLFVLSVPPFHFCTFPFQTPSVRSAMRRILAFPSRSRYR